MIMSKYDEYIQMSVDYIGQIVGERLVCVPLAVAVRDGLPSVISGSYALYGVTGGRRSFILALCVGGFTAGRLQKHMTLIERTTGMTVIFVFKGLVAYNVKRMIEAKVNFVVPYRQMFAPSMLVDLRKPKQTDCDLSETMPVIAQCVLLYHLEKETMDGKTIQDVIDLFGTSYATANRAVRWLAGKNLIGIETAATREKVIRLSADKRKVWDAALPFFTTPVGKTVHTDDECPECLESGVNALAEHTMINRERTLTYAVSKEEFGRLGHHTDKLFGDNAIEVWRYDPHLLADSNTVDRLSLYLTLRDNQDERIQKELESLINRMEW